MIKLEPTGDESFVIRCDEPMRLGVRLVHGVLIAHVYSGAIDDEDQEPIFAFDSSIENAEVLYERED